VEIGTVLVCEAGTEGRCHNTPVEQRDLALLKALGFEVVNPNTPEHDAVYKASGMAHFDKLIEGCDALAFRAFPDGGIPAGVVHEIAAAIDKPVFELPGGILRRALSVAVTRETLRDSGAR
jgi:hypothetical protein